jgi:hypothetical protein
MDDQVEHRDESIAGPGMERLSDAALIRAASDGEPGARSELNRRAISEPDVRIAFEGALRDSVARVMGAEGAPLTVRTSVLSILREVDVEAPVSFLEAKARHEAHQGTSSTSAGMHRRRSARLVRGLAIAAVVGLASGAVWMGWQSGQHAGAPPSQNASFASALSYVRHEHNDRSAFDEQYRTSFTVDIDEALRVAEHELGSMPGCLARAIRGCADSGLVFAGLRACPVPGGAGAVHVMYWSAPDESAVSMFVVADPGQGTGKTCATKALKGDTSYVCKKSQDQGTPMQVWRRGDFTFYLTSGAAAPVPLVRKLHDAPQRTEPIAL